MPAPIDRELPTFADGSPAWGDASWLASAGNRPTELHRLVSALGFDIARVYFSPRLGRPDGTLDPDSLRDLTDHLALLRACGVSRYCVTVWSPPAFMKRPDRVRYGKFEGRTQSLDPAFADGQGYDYADYLADACQALVKAGCGKPEGVSIQNEPSVAQAYDGCVWTESPEQLRSYRDTVKRLRVRLDASGMADVPILVPEEDSLVGITRILGEPTGEGFAAMEADPEFGRAVGAFAFHTYATAGNIAAIRAAMARYPDRAVWMTEYSTATGIRGELQARSGDDQLDWTINNVRRMAGDLVDLGVSRWFFWRGWHSAGQADDQDLVYDGPCKTRAYHVFQKLWTEVPSGWSLVRVNAPGGPLRADNAGLIASGSGDQWSAPVDILAFQSPDGQRGVTLLINARAEGLTVELAGMRGRSVEAFVTDRGRDMATLPGALGAGRMRLELPPWSVVIVVGR
jgi:hypothetical protein